MSYNDLIRRLLAAEGRGQRGILSEAAEAIEELEQRWISVKDRLPEEKDGKVLAFTHFGFSICHVRADGSLSGMYADWITHWMPPPEPPKEG